MESAVLLTDILPTGYLGAQRARIAPGATVVLFGLGPVGVMALHESAELLGPARILAVGTGSPAGWPGELSSGPR